MWSREGLLIKTVEYAMEAISHAGTVLAVASKEGIAIAAEKVCTVIKDWVKVSLTSRRKSRESCSISHSRQEERAWVERALRHGWAVGERRSSCSTSQCDQDSFVRTRVTDSAATFLLVSPVSHQMPTPSSTSRETRLSDISSHMTRTYPSRCLFSDYAT